MPTGGSNPPLSASSFDGGVAEWFKAAVLKTVELQGSGGSNPSSSAISPAVGESTVPPPGPP